MSDRHICKAKRTDNGEWVEGFYVMYSTSIFHPYSYTKGKHCIQTVPHNIQYEVDPETVCQYTGLTDKNGNKIFEGDIVNVNFKEGRIGTVEKIYSYTVKFNQRNAYFELIGNDELLGRPCLCSGNQFITEVIGNIFDNPELLKGGAE